MAKLLVCLLVVISFICVGWEDLPHEACQSVICSDSDIEGAVKGLVEKECGAPVGEVILYRSVKSNGVYTFKATFSGFTTVVRGMISIVGCDAGVMFFDYRLVVNGKGIFGRSHVVRDSSG